MFKYILVASVALLMVCPSIASAKTLTLKKAQVEVTPPAEWKKESLKNEDLRFTAPDKLVVINLILLDKSDVKLAIKATLEKVKKNFTDFSVKEPKDLKINGMKAVFVVAKGKKNNIDLGLGMMLVETPSKKVLLIQTVIPKNVAKQHKATTETFIKSIKPIK